MLGLKTLVSFSAFLAFSQLALADFHMDLLSQQAPPTYSLREKHQNGFSKQFASKVSQVLSENKNNAVQPSQQTSVQVSSKLRRADDLEAAIAATASNFKRVIG